MVARKAASRCSRCESEEMIPDGWVFDMNRDMTGALQAGFIANPKAIVFKGKTYNSVWARLCGSCGFIELFVADPQKLYAEYRKARGKNG